MQKKIITHEDFDGLVCAVLCSHALKINYIEFTGPRTVSEARISITDLDVVCDLPYPLQCGLWFDHHLANLEELQYRGIDPNGLQGQFAAEASCARVVYHYFLNSHAFPDFFESLVAEADIIDSFNYSSIADWRRETSGKVIDATIKLQQQEGGSGRWQFLRDLVRHLKAQPLDSVAAMPGVQERYRQFQREEEEMLDRISRDTFFLPQDSEKQLIIIDLTHHNRRPKIVKQLAFLLHPQASAVLEVGNLFQNQVKTTDLSFSLSLSLNLNQRAHSKEVGDIFRRLNIGSGHRGAGAGTLSCASKNEMLRTKDKTIEQIYLMFAAQ